MGFTMVELIVVIVVLGIVALIAGPRFFSTSQFAAMGFADTAASATRYAQKLAMASGCPTRVQVTSSQVALFQRASCSTGDFDVPVQRPGGAAFVVEVQGGIVVSALDFYFDATGIPYYHPSGSKLTGADNFTIQAGAVVNTVIIEAETGYVHQS